MWNEEFPPYCAVTAIQVTILHPHPNLSLCTSLPAEKPLRSGT